MELTHTLPPADTPLFAWKTPQDVRVRVTCLGKASLEPARQSSQGGSGPSLHALLAFWNFASWHLSEFIIMHLLMIGPRPLPRQEGRTLQEDWLTSGFAHYDISRHEHSDGPPCALRNVCWMNGWMCD